MWSSVYSGGLSTDGQCRYRKHTDNIQTTYGESYNTDASGSFYYMPSAARGLSEVDHCCMGGFEGGCEGRR